MKAVKIECNPQESSDEKIHSFRASSKGSLKIEKPINEFVDESHTPQFSSGEAERSPLDQQIKLTSFLNQNRGALNDSIIESNKMKRPPTHPCLQVVKSKTVVDKKSSVGLKDRRSRNSRKNSATVKSIDTTFKYQPVLGTRIPLNMKLTTSSLDIPKKDPMKHAFEKRRLRSKKMSVQKELPADVYEFKPKLIGVKKRNNSKNVKSL